LADERVDESASGLSVPLFTTDAHLAVIVNDAHDVSAAETLCRLTLVPISLSLSLSIHGVFRSDKQASIMSQTAATSDDVLAAYYVNGAAAYDEIRIRFVRPCELVKHIHQANGAPQSRLGPKIEALFDPPPRKNWRGVNEMSKSMFQDQPRTQPLVYFWCPGLLRELIDRIKLPIRAQLWCRLPS